MNELNERIAFYEIDKADAASFRSVNHILRKNIGKALDRFYRKVNTVPALNHFFNDHNHMARAKNAQQSHWLGAFGQGIDQTYYQRALNIGNVHARIGLEPKWYVGGYSLILQDIIHAMVAPGWTQILPWRRAQARRISLFVKVALLDMDIALSTYFAANEEKTNLTIQQLGQALSTLANNDLSANVQNLPGEFHQIQIDYNAAVTALRGIIAQVMDSARAISSGSSEINSASNDLALRTEQQANSLAETAGSLRSVTQIVQETAQNTEIARSSVGSAYEEAQLGGDVVQRTVEAMRGIEHSSQEIGKIVTLIDGIAFQTNLLALNAGVEAARAGSAGAGFAVVATEVRALAQRSADAARDIRELIAASTGQVANGVGLVDETGRMLGLIVASVGQLRSTLDTIARSANDQARNMKQIDAAVSQMDLMTQQNAAMVEQTSAAARSLAEQAGALDNLVGSFNLGTGAIGRPGHNLRQLAA